VPSATNTTQDHQAELPGMEIACADVGLDSVPQGMARLTKKQSAFVLGFLRTGNASEAARLAGYSDPSADGSKIQKAPEVAAILSQAALPVARNADQIVRRVSERARIAHFFIEREMAKPETTRSVKTIREWMDSANKADALLGTLLGKIQGIHVSGSVKHEHQHQVGGQVQMIHESALPALAEIRRAVVADRLHSATGGAN
jgi:hypothetical protein